MNLQNAEAEFIFSIHTGGASSVYCVLEGERSDKSCFVPIARRGKTLIMQKVLR